VPEEVLQYALSFWRGSERQFVLTFAVVRALPTALDSVTRRRKCALIYIRGF
jgi:hypothetical protein